MIVADTDVLIDFLAGRRPAGDRVREQLRHGGLATTAVSRFELLSGAAPGRYRESVERLLEAVTTLPLDSPAADRAAEVRRSLEGRGIPIGMGDCLIAGIVLVRGGSLMTRNRRHFARVEDLRLEDLAAG